MSEVLDRVEKRGIEQGIEQGKMIAFRNMLKRGYSIEEAQDISELTDKQIEEFCREEGRKEGFEEGRKEGIEEGSEKAKIQIYSNLLSSGCPQEEAQKICGLSDEQVKHLQFED